MKLTLMSKKRSTVFFSGKIGVALSVAHPGDTNPSDAMGHIQISLPVSMLIYVIFHDMSFCISLPVSSKSNHLRRNNIADSAPFCETTKDAGAV